jgi:hypothetical protein
MSEYLKKLQEDLKRKQLEQGEPPSLQKAFKNLGSEMGSFFGGPDKQAESRDKKKKIRSAEARDYSNTLLENSNREAGGSTMFNLVNDPVNDVVGPAKGQQLLDMARGPKFPMLDAGTDIANPALTRETSPEGSLKADQLLAAASEPMTLDGVVDDVMDNQDEGKFKPAGDVPSITPDETPKAQDFVDKIDAPQFDPSKLVTKNSQGNYVRDENPQNIMMAQRGFNLNQRDMELRDRTDKRKDFASTLDAANYDPSTASSEDKANFYAQGKELGLSSRQIDKYANDQLDKNAKRVAGRNMMGGGTTSSGVRGSSSGVSTEQSRKGVQGATSQVQNSASRIAGGGYTAGRGSSLRQEPKRISSSPTPSERRAAAAAKKEEEDEKKNNA